jgi:hypothetical protein
VSAVDVSVLTAGHDLADARMHRIVGGLTRAGLRVEVFGLGDDAAAPAGVVAVHAGRRRGHLGRVATAATLPWRARGRLLLVLAPEGVPVAAFAGRLRRRKLAVDVYEDYLALAHDRPLSPPARAAAGLLVRAATALAARADVTSVADDHVPPGRARRRVVVRNYPEPGQVPSDTPLDREPRAVYIGDIRRSRGLPTMLDMLEAAPEWTLDLVGPVRADDQALLDGWLSRSPAAARLRLHGRLPPDRAWAVAAGAWAGLALLEDTPAFRAAMPSKLYEYVGAGLAVLTSPLPRMRAFVTETGAGRVAASAAEAAAVLNAWAAEPATLHAARAAAQAWAASALGGPSPYDGLAHELAALVHGQP